MFRKVIHHALALALVITWTGLTGRVLCIGSDGHHEIELRDATCCAARTVDDTPSVQAQCSGGCTDTPLALTAISQKSALHMSPALLPSATVPVGGLADGMRRAAWSPSQQSPPARPPRLLGTAVHLC